MNTKPIGGYFEFELKEINKNYPPLGYGRHVNSGRHALEYILRASEGKIKSLYVPYYTCDVVTGHLRRMNIDYHFYSINKNLELVDDINLNEGEYILVNNYFGIKDDYIETLSSRYKTQLIVDNAQAWYARPILGVNTFYSPRKFFGLPDGGIAIPTFPAEIELEQDHSSDRCSHLLKRIDEGPSEGYSDFRKSSNKLKEEPLKAMSSLTQAMLKSIDFDWIKIKRRRNFDILHYVFASSNQLTIPDIRSFACPMVYPYLTDDATLRQKLIDNKIFVATYWPNVLDLCTRDTVEYKLATNLIPLPIDQRYGQKEMERIINVING